MQAGQGAGQAGGRGAQAASIAAALAAEIVAGRHAPGSRLGQDALARRFGTSRMPVREALGRLAAEGLVTLMPNRSALVAGLDAGDMADIFDMRIALETLALRLALPRLGNADIAAAAAVQDLIEAGGAQDAGRLNAGFHGLLYAPCARPRLLREIAQLSRHADRYLRVALAAAPQRATSDAEHRALLAACLARDEVRALALLETHIATARDGLMRRLGAG